MVNDNDAGSATLRAEAQPAQWDDLFDGQQAAVTQLLKFFTEAVNLVGEGPTTDEHDGDWMMHRAPNTTVLLGGDRGTGKTTVFFSAVAGVRNGDIGAGKHHDITKVLKNLEQRVLFLEPLDLEPFPTSVNLLSAILARLDDATRGWRGSEPASSYTGVLDPSPLRGGQADLAALQRDVALAWDGNLDDRKGSLDPDNFAAETKAVERARLSLNRRFSDLLDELAEASPRPGLFRPVFVLAVDDFDLNPKMTVELARLLRMLKTPRLMILILGDLDLIEQVYRLNLEREFTEIGGGPGYDESTRITVLADRLAKHQLRKSLPPEQRIVLRSVSGARLLTFRPLGGADRSVRLHQLLDKVGWAQGGTDGETASALDFLTPPPLLRRRRDDSDAAPQSVLDRVLDFVGLDLLEMTPRELNDFRAEIPREQSPAWFRHFIMRRLDEADLLRASRSTPTADDADSVEEDFLREETHVTITSRRGPPVAPTGTEGRPTVRLAELRFDASAENRSYGHADSRLLAAGREWFGDSLNIVGTFASTRYDRVDLEWPMPELDSAWALARLLDAVRDAPQSDTDLDHAIARWIYLGTLIQEEPRRLRAPQIDAPLRQKTVDWEPVASVLDEFRSQGQSGGRDDWVRGCVALSFPEMGASREAHTHFVKSVKHGMTQKAIRDVRLERLQRLHGSLTGDRSERKSELERLGITLPDTTPAKYDPALKELIGDDADAVVKK